MTQSPHEPYEVYTIIISCSWKKNWSRGRKNNVPKVTLQETEAGIASRRPGARAHGPKLFSNEPLLPFTCPLLPRGKSRLNWSRATSWESPINSQGKMHKWCPSFEQILTHTEIHFCVLNPKERSALQSYFIHLIVLCFMNKLKGKKCAHYVIMLLTGLNPLKPHVYISQLLDNSVWGGKN